MGFIKSVSIVSVLVLLLAITVSVYQEYLEKSDRIIFEDWSNKNKIDASNLQVNEFKIEFNQADWDDLVKRLENTRYFNLLNESMVQRFEYGFDPEYAKILVNYWKKKFNWKNQVNYLNKFKQFKVRINGVDVHFLRIKTGKNEKNLIPLLMVDGWPGSFFGFYKMLDYFIEKNIAYDIIIPSIPGYGYSSPLNEPVTLLEVSRYFDALMRSTHGESVQYFIHGEDWGSVITRIMAHLYPQRVKGVHITLPFFNPFYNLQATIQFLLSSLLPSYVLTPEEVEYKLNEIYSVPGYLKALWNEFAYYHLQATKPDTLGHGLTDSPVGLLAYILEKYSSWSFDFKEKILGSPSGNLEEFNKDDLLTITSIYWFTNSISSSMRLYKSSKRDLFDYPASLIHSIKSEVPISVQMSKYELVMPSNSVRYKYPNLKEFKLIETGHFASFHNPKKTGDSIIRLVNACN